jgi:hypothetical protein
MEPEGSLPPCSQYSATVPNPEPEDPIHAFPPYWPEIHSNIILSRTRRSSAWSLPFKNFVFLISSMRATFLDHLILLHFIILILFGEEQFFVWWSICDKIDDVWYESHVKFGLQYIDKGQNEIRRTVNSIDSAKFYRIPSNSFGYEVWKWRDRHDRPHYEFILCSLCKGGLER